MFVFFKNIFLGVLIGIGSILPGISSGVILVSFGLYEKLLNSILNFFVNIRENLKLLIPIITGIGIGAILFGNILSLLYNLYPSFSKYCFIGLILGTLPNVIKSANNNNKYFEFKNIIFTIISLILSLIMILIEKKFTSILITTNEFDFFYLILSGFLMSIGVVVPRNK